MPRPTLSFNPSCPTTATPGQSLTLNTVLTPSRSGGYFDWTFPPEITAPVPTDGPQSQTFNAPTQPGAYTVSTRTYWLRFGNYEANIPFQTGSDPQFGAIVGGTVGGRVETVETFTNSTTLDLRVRLRLPAAFACANTFEGYYLVANDIANGNQYFAYVVWNGTNWFIQARDRINGVETVRATSPAINFGDNTELRIVNGDIQVFGPGAGNLIFNWGGNQFLGREFSVIYDPFVSCVPPNSYPQPSITTPTGFDLSR